MRKKPRAVILGGDGFLGSWVKHAFEAKGTESIVVGRRLTTAGIRLDVQDADRLRAVLADSGAEIILHLANASFVPTSFEEPALDLVANVASTINVLESVRLSAPAARLVYVSSAAVYGEPVGLPISEDHPRCPLSPYGASKLAAESYVDLYRRLYGVRTTIVRPFSLYGPGQRKQVVYDLLKRAMSGEDPLVIRSSAHVVRDFLYVGDAANTMVKLSSDPRAEGRVFNLASGTATTLAELAQEIVAVVPGGATYRFTGLTRLGDPTQWKGDTTQAAVLGARSDTDLREGLARTAAWIRDGEPLAVW